MSQRTKDFHKCTTMTKRNGVIEIECKLGLWSVQGKFMMQVINEALHYFDQYKRDGEYSSIIGGKSVIEVMTSRNL